MRDLTAMALLVHVAERGSFTAAARHLGEPLSTISRRIAELEKSLGVRLLERTTRSLRLTDIGQNYYEHCRRGLEEFDSANLLIENRLTDVSGLLRISLPPNVAEDLFMPVIDRFQATYPRARILVLVTDRHVDFVADSIDLAFRVGPISTPSLTVRRIARYRHRLVASPDYLADRLMPKNPPDLTSHRLIAFGAQNGPVNWQLNELGSQDKGQTEAVSFEPSLTVNDYRAVISAVERGMGIAEVPEIFCQTALAEARLVPVLSGWGFAPVSLSALHTGTRSMSRLVRLFLDLCVDHFRTMINDFPSAAAD